MCSTSARSTCAEVARPRAHVIDGIDLSREFRPLLWRCFDAAMRDYSGGLLLSEAACHGAPAPVV